MGRSCNQTEKPGGQRTIESDMVGMFPEKLGGQSHEIVKTSGRL